MGMVVYNNVQSMTILGENNRNQKSLSKATKQLALGEKITGAGDGASEYSISEKMRTNIRSLDQDIVNARTGERLIGTAASGIQ